jgi:hypothetical protein
MFVAKTAEQQAAGFVVANNTDRKHIDAEISEIIDRIRAATRDYSALAMPQDQHRSFSRNARNFTEDKFVGHHVAEHSYGDARERLNDFAQPVGGFW